MKTSVAAIMMDCQDEWEYAEFDWGSLRDD